MWAAERDTREKVGAWLGRLLTKVERGVEKERLRDEKRLAKQAERELKMRQEQAERERRQREHAAQAQLRQAEMLDRQRRIAEQQLALHAEAAAKFTAKTARPKPKQPKRALLPPGWHSRIDPASGYAYYCNPSANTTQWERPKTSAPLSAAAGGGGLTSALCPAAACGWPQAAYAGAAMPLPWPQQQQQQGQQQQQQGQQQGQQQQGQQQGQQIHLRQHFVQQQPLWQQQQQQWQQQAATAQQQRGGVPASWPPQQGSAPSPRAPSSLAWHTGPGRPSEMGGVAGSSGGGRAEGGAGSAAEGALPKQRQIPRVILKLVYPPHLEHLRPKPRKPKPPPPRRPSGPPAPPRAQWAAPYVPPPQYLPMPQPAAAAPPPAPQSSESSDWTSKLAVLLATLRGQLAPVVFAQVEQLVMDMQSQRVQLNREQFLQRIQAITKG